MSWRDVKTVLVVDDDPDMLHAMRRRLRGAGIDVLTASSGVEALDLAQHTTVDAITLDVCMPGSLDGLDVAAALHSHPGTAEIPVIFVTGTADSMFKQKCEAVGARYFLAKPYDAELLIRLLESIFGQDDLAEIQKLSQAKRRQPMR